jgi:hypothetical protein
MVFNLGLRVQDQVRDKMQGLTIGLWLSAKELRVNPIHSQVGAFLRPPIYRGVGVRIQELKASNLGSGFRVQDSGFRVQGSGFRV